MATIHPNMIQPLDRPWQEIRARYESGERLATLCREYNVKSQTMAMRKTRECWLSPKPKEHELRTKLKGKLAQVLDILPDVRPSMNSCERHAQVLSTLTQSARLVEGWSDTQSPGLSVALFSLDASDVSTGNIIDITSEKAFLSNPEPQPDPPGTPL